MILTREIIRRILLNLGISINHFGKEGITTKEYIVDQLSIESEDNNKIQCNIYCGEANLNTFKVRAAFLDLLDHEYVLAFKADNMPMFGIKICLDDNEENEIFNISFEENKINWKNTSILIQAETLCGVEQITQLGICWDPCDNFKDLKEAIMSLV
jgi:hypothetical protein